MIIRRALIGAAGLLSLAPGVTAQSVGPNGAYFDRPQSSSEWGPSQCPRAAIVLNKIDAKVDGTITVPFNSFGPLKGKIEGDIGADGQLRVSLSGPPDLKNLSIKGAYTGEVFNVTVSGTLPNGDMTKFRNRQCKWQAILKQRPRQSAPQGET